MLVVESAGPDDDVCVAWRNTNVYVAAMHSMSKVRLKTKRNDGKTVNVSTVLFGR